MTDLAAADGPPSPADAAALARLPVAGLGVPGLDADPAWRLAAPFLFGYRVVASDRPANCRLRPFE